MQDKPTSDGRLARISFLLSAFSVPIAILSLVIFKTVIYNPILESLNLVLFILCLIMPAVSVVLGITAIIKTYAGKNALGRYRLAVTGITISLLLFVVYGYNAVILMLEHLP